jgi:hypothetical protein
VVFFQGVVVYSFQQSLDSSLHPPFIVFVTQVMWCELVFQAVRNCIGFSSGRNFRPKEPWCLWPTPLYEGFRNGPYNLRCDLTVALFRVILLIDFVTQLTAILHAESLVSCHNFLSLCLCFNNQSRPVWSLFMPESVILLVDKLYAEAIEAVKSRTDLSASTPELISILGDINSEIRL